jgi:tight adherence protein C
MVGSLLGFTAGSGAVMTVLASPPMRPVRLYERVAPYVGEMGPTSRLLSAPVTAVPFVVCRRLFGPALSDVLRAVERMVGGSSSVRRRLTGLGIAADVEEFRMEQAMWGAVCGCGLALLAVAAGLMRGHVDPVLVGGAVIVGGVGGILARDSWLTRQLRQRERRMVCELPVVADLLALAVVAGEGPAAALARVTSATRGELARDLEGALRSTRSGTTLGRALTDVARSTTCESFARLLKGLAIAIERGTPLAHVLRAQAMDARDGAQRALLDAGGKKEISMMLPVVFMILPVTVLFALYPGLLTLTSIAR